MTDRLEMPIEQFVEAVSKENDRLRHEIEQIRTALASEKRITAHLLSQAEQRDDEIEQLEAALRELVEAWDFWQSQETRNGFSELFASICEARTASGDKKDD